MREDWINFRGAWNAEANRLTGDGLGDIFDISRSYVSALGRGNKRFNETYLEKFSEHMGLPLSVLFSKSALQIPPEEAEEMKNIKEMVQVMLAQPSIKTILLGEYEKLKLSYASELSKKKFPEVLCRKLNF